MKSSSERAWLLVLMVLAGIGLYAGWRTFWFLCDDAYIAFRYVSNSVLGHGYVWNPPPFHRVEGYSSFLWVVLLDVIWRVSGVEPPDAANPLSLAFSAGSVALVTLMVLRLDLSARLARHRLPLLALVLLGLLTNRTFLAWTSSGLETAMFGFWVLAWVYAGLFRPLDRANLGLVAGLAAVLHLSRPDGMLFLLATAAVLALDALRRARAGTWRPVDLLPWAAFTVPAAHVAWRLSFYGYPLPNPAYAKHTKPWPEMGLQYLASFVLEYGYAVWALVAVGAGVALLRRHGAGALARVREEGLMRAAFPAAIAAQAGYYTLVIGGDHFEYRVYWPLVPLSYVSMVWLLDRVRLGPRGAAAAFGAMLLLGWPLPWVHWYHTHDITKQHERGMPKYAIAKHFPAPLDRAVEVFDGLQRSMITHFVGMRHQTHVIYGMHVQPGAFPTREEGLAIRDDADPPVFLKGGVGYPSWVLPHVAIIDYRGLNDVIVARHPIRELKRNGKPKRRLIAHEREAPKGYNQCFLPNVKVRKGQVEVTPRAAPLTAERIRDCEARFLAQVLGGTAEPGDDDDEHDPEEQAAR